ARRTTTSASRVEPPKRPDPPITQMKRFLAAVVVLIPVSLVAQQAARPVTISPKPVVSHEPAAATMTVAEQNAIVKQYCVGCHNDRNKDRTSGLSFQSFDATNVVEHADTVERMIRRLRSGMMPPVGAKRPDQATINTLVNAFEAKIDRAAALNPNPGWRPSQRLNRAEYQRAVKDLLA